MSVTEVDGVPTLFVPSAGPIRAGLMFRVGRADETLATSGITHLVEHLALHRHGLLEHHANASVGAITTHFYTSGSAQAVVAFLNVLCASLADLPTDRIPVEKEILRAESASRAGSDVPLWRYGAQGYGLVSLRELGLYRLSDHDVTSWARAWFTRENAVLWIAGERVPPDLRLDLPSGPRRPTPLPTDGMQATPAYIHGPIDGVVLHALAPRSIASVLYADVLERSLYQTLRLEAGFSYAIGTDCSPRGDDRSVITAFADALPENRGAVIGGFVDTLNRRRKAGIAADERDDAVTRALADFDHPEIEVVRLPARAHDLLTGHPDRTTADLVADINAVSTSDLNEVAREVYQSAVLQVPYGYHSAVSGFTPGRLYSAAAVNGARFSGRRAYPCSLVIGAEGVSVLDTEKTVATVRFSQCAARLDWPDGASTFIGLDGSSVAVEPTLYRINAQALAGLGHAVPASVRIPMPDRSPDQIPQPTNRSGPHPTGPRPTLRKIELAVMTVLALGLGLAFVTMANAWRPSDGPLMEKIIFLPMIACAATALRAFFIAFRRLRWGIW